MLKKRKKAKKKLICIKLPFTSQNNYPLKFLNLYSEEISFRSIENRVSQSLVDTFINFKNNPIYLRRSKSYLAALRKIKI